MRHCHISMNKPFLLRSHFDTCHGLIAQLKNVIAKADLMFCHYYQLPKIKEASEFGQINTIPVKAHEAHQALIHCNNAFTDVLKQPNLSGKMLVRHPAIIAIKGDNPRISALVNAINNEKQQFKQIVLSEKSKDARFELVHGAVPNLITLAFYRQLFIEQKAPYSVRFTWMHKHSIQHFTRDQALAMLARSKQRCDQQYTFKHATYEQIEQEQYRISHLASSHIFRIRRPIRVSPQVNIRFSATNRYHVSAALPFILLNAEKTNKIGSLPDYVKKSDTRQKKSRYLIERLFLESKRAD